MSRKTKQNTEKSPYVAANSQIINAHKHMLNQNIIVKTKYCYDSSQSVKKRKKKKRGKKQRRGMHQDLSYTEETKVIACETIVVDAAFLY